MYEEYMQNFLNYPINPYQNTYDQNLENYLYSYNDSIYGYNRYPYRNVNQNNEIENFYPEIYKVVYPMVKKVCNKNSRSLSRDSIEEMVDEVYNNLEETNFNSVELNINLTNEVRTNSSTKPQEKQVVENRQRPVNNTLRDLIKILLIRELLRKPGCCGHNNRPPRPTRPTYPPIPPRPPMPRYNWEESEIGYY